VVGREISQEPGRRPVDKREPLTWKRVNRKLKRILKRREIERLKKERYEDHSQGPRQFRDPV